ncbi:hypothetical protein ACN28C_14670 [Plantactinospora sp. WMMC1484]|uniref:hypothetical protein n=1 Tax=Plantactinospora sp. WMMC1484 TaxID=3404122 RepID=UPI003BF4A84A
MSWLLRQLTGLRPYHRRDWRRLWRYCRCGWRWRCPDSLDLVPVPYQPPPPLTEAELTEAERAEIRALATMPPPADVSNTPAPPARAWAHVRAGNRRVVRAETDRAHPINARAEGLLPAPAHRARHRSART